MIIKIKQSAVHLRGDDTEYRKTVMEYEVEIPFPENYVQAKIDDFVSQLHYLIDRLHAH